MTDLVAVFGILIVMWAGIAFYLFQMNKKLSKLEKLMENQNE